MATAAARLLVDERDERVERAEVVLGDLGVLDRDAVALLDLARRARRSPSESITPSSRKSILVGQLESGCRYRKFSLDVCAQLVANAPCPYAQAPAMRRPPTWLRDPPRQASMPHPSAPMRSRAAHVSSASADAAEAPRARPASRDADERHPLAEARSRARRGSAAAGPRPRARSKMPDRVERLGREALVDPPGLVGEERRGLGRAVGLLRALRHDRAAATSAASARSAIFSRRPAELALGRQRRRSARRRGGRGTGSGPRRRAPSRRGRPGRPAGMAEQRRQLEVGGALERAPAAELLRQRRRAGAPADRSRRAAARVSAR